MYSATIASQKYGNALRNASTDGSHASNQPWRFQAADDTQERADREADDNGTPREEQRPGEPRTDHFGDGSREVGDGDTEVAAQHVAQVRDVLLQQRCFREPEGLTQRLDGLRAQPTAESGKERGCRIARHQTRQEEVQRQCDPARERIEAETLKDVAHARSAWLDRGQDQQNVATVELVGGRVGVRNVT